jgi:nucleoside-diphosphate-sugar epimerase
MSVRVLISGGAGYIGSILSQYLHDRKINFAIIDDLSNSSIKFFPKNFKDEFDKSSITAKFILRS